MSSKMLGPVLEKGVGQLKSTSPVHQLRVVNQDSVWAKPKAGVSDRQNHGAAC
jgi:hypothetical protein